MSDSEKIPQPDTNAFQKVLGKNIMYAPRPALTADVGTTAGSSYTSTEQGLINNHTTRIDQIEAVLIKLGLLKHS